MPRPILKAVLRPDELQKVDNFMLRSFVEDSKHNTWCVHVPYALRRAARLAVILCCITLSSLILTDARNCRLWAVFRMSCNCGIERTMA